MTKVFDMPHARVTLTPVGPGVEIEVWPKAGQSAYAVVDPLVAVEIAKSLVELAARQLDIVRAAQDKTDESPDTSDGPAGDGAGAGDDPPPEDEPGAAEPPTNIVDLASRRRPPR